MSLKLDFQRDGMDIKRLETENRYLKQEVVACHEQGRLFESLLKMMGSAPEKKMLIHTMKKTMEITARLSGAQAGSLFLLDDSGVVTEAILTRGEVGSDMKTALLGTVLDKGLAGWVRTHLKVGLVHDTLTDSRWISLPDEPYKVRSVLSVPIIRQASLFGIVTLMHPDPDFFQPETVEAVQMTADHMAVAIEGAQIYVRLEELNQQRQKALERDLALARQVQESFLPARMPRVEGFEFSALNEPALAVGGDFYCFYQLPGNKLGVALGDVSGKGIAASLFMARLSSELAHYAPLFIDPGRLLSKVNQVLCDRAKQGMFVTLIYLVVDLETNVVLFANAGHLPPAWMERGEVRYLKAEEAKGPPLGILPEAVFGQQSFTMGENDVVVLFTDGVVETRHPDKGILGFERLKTEIGNHAGEVPKDLIKGIVRAVGRFSPSKRAGDDLTLVCFRRIEGSGQLSL